MTKLDLLHDDHNVRLSSLNPFIGYLIERVCTSTSKPSAGNIQEDRKGQLLRIIFLQSRRPDMEIEAIFGLSSIDQELRDLCSVDGRAITELLHA